MFHRVFLLHGVLARHLRGGQRRGTWAVGIYCPPGFSHLHGSRTREQQFCCPKPCKIWRFIFISLVQDQGNCSARDSGGGEGDCHGWERRFSLLYSAKELPLTHLPRPTAAPNLRKPLLLRISGKLTTPTDWMLSNTRRLQALNDVLIKAFLAISI